LQKDSKSLLSINAHIMKGMGGSEKWFWLHIATKEEIAGGVIIARTLTQQ
jgi:hypothetical protein